MQILSRNTLMPEYRIYHNPRCRKSRETLALLEEAGAHAEVVLYLEMPPTRAELEKLSQLLDLRPIEMTRTKEALFRELELSKDAPDADILDALAAHPRLIERPIVVKDGTEAVIGHPPEKVRELL